MLKYIIAGITTFFTLLLIICSIHVVPPGHRGIKVLFGSTDSNALNEGLSFSNPLSVIEDVSVRQETKEFSAECFSSDLQQVNSRVKILYRVPQQSVVSVFRDYKGDPFTSLVEPRVQEAVKEATATRTAEGIVKNREEVKAVSLATSRKKLNGFIEIDDLVIEDLALSKELKVAIEQKMVQEQEAAKAKFTQQKAEIDSKTAVIRATGEAEAIKIRGAALRENPALIQLQLVEKWDGKAPQYIGGGASGANIILPVSK